MPECCDCKFYEPSSKDEGECRVLPPIAGTADHGAHSPGEAVWPKVFAGDWCARFERRPGR
jgi:hypothetical protein